MIFMAKDKEVTTPKPQPKPESREDTKQKVNWTMNKPNPKTEKQPEIAEPEKLPKSISSLSSQKHRFEGAKIRVEKGLHTR